MSYYNWSSIGSSLQKLPEEQVIAEQYERLMSERAALLAQIKAAEAMIVEIDAALLVLKPKLAEPGIGEAHGDDSV
jgi:hypothetical protein